MALENKYSWHPQFAVHSFSDNKRLLLSEAQHNIVHVEDSHLTLVEHNGSGLGFQGGKASLPFNAQAQFMALLGNGYVVARGGLSAKYSWHVPNFLAPVPEPQSLAPNLEVLLLTQFQGVHHGLAGLLDTLPAYAGSLCIVVADDYLDPRLAAIDRQFRATNQPWLLLKLTGEYALVGPVFLPENGQPCWHCVQHRMKANQGMRWLHHKSYFETEAPPLAVPIRYDGALLEKYGARLRALIGQYAGQRLTRQITEVNGVLDKELTHPVIQRPQCPNCGNPNFMKTQAEAPLTLQAVGALANRDGGVRHQLAEETGQQLLALKSPLSGLINHFTSYSPAGEGRNRIYRSGFYQLPPKHGALTPADFVYVTMGKGISQMQSQASALSEAIERLAAAYQGDEWCKQQMPTDQAGDYLLPSHLQPYSARQYKAFTQAPDTPAHSLYGVARYNNNEPLRWTRVWSLTHQRPKYVPLSYCFSNTPFDDRKYCRYFHNGGAAGVTLEEAVLQAFLELVERDAVAIWWYNRIVRPEVDCASMSPLLQEQLHETLGEAWRYWALDLTHDFNIPVVAAMAQHRATGRYSFGFGCHQDAQIAAERAFTELIQITEIRDRNVSPFEFNAIQEGAYLHPGPAQARLLAQLPTQRHTVILEAVNHALARAHACGLEVLALNYSRPDMYLKTARVIMPGTCHIFPYLGAERLYQVPVAMGWRKQPLAEAELNPQALLI